MSTGTWIRTALVGLAALTLSAPAMAGPVKVVLAPTIVAPAPPPPVVRVRVARPAPAAVWVEGHWSRDMRGRRVWVPGYWAQHAPVRRTVTTVHTPVGVVRTVKMH